MQATRGNVLSVRGYARASRGKRRGARVASCARHSWAEFIEPSPSNLLRGESDAQHQDQSHVPVYHLLLSNVENFRMHEIMPFLSHTSAYFH